MKYSQASIIRNCCALTALMIAAEGVSNSAWAQDNDDYVGLETILVTAERRVSTLQQTPLAITAVGAEELRQRNIESLLDIGALAPNVFAGSQTAGGGQNGGFFIRGVGQERRNVVFDQGIGLYIDDVFLSRSDANFLNIIDVERIEVLRGPQGTLFGKNTIGGAIRYIVKKPSDEFGGYIDGTVGNFDRVDVRGTINVPLTDKIFAKATFGALNRDGFIDSLTDNTVLGDEQVRFASLQLRAELSEKVTLDLSASRSLSDNNGRAFIVDFISPTASFPSFTGTSSGQIYDERFLSPDIYTRVSNERSSYSYDDFILSATLNVALSDAINIKSITSYIEADVDSETDWDGSPVPVFDLRNIRAIDQFSQEVQLSGTIFDNRLTYVAGLFYLRETPSELQEVFTGFIPGGGPFLDAPRLRTEGQDVDTFAAFAQGTFSVTDKLDVTLGLRYSRDEKTVQSATINSGFAAEGSDAWGDVSPRVSVQYQWTDDIMTYATVAKGFRSGGLNTRFFGGVTDLTRLSFAPEIVWNYEAGIRTEFFDNRARVNLTGFYMDYTDQQLTFFDEASQLVIIQNVGESSRAGIELETQVNPIEGLTISGNVGYLDAQYDDVGGSGAEGVTVDSTPPRSPEWTFNIGGSYEIPAGEGSVVVSTNYNYRTSQTTTSTDGNTQFLDEYGLLTARLQYNSPEDVWNIAFFATNLLDKEYFIGGIDFARREGALGFSQLDVGRPREFGVNLRYNF